jgi:Cu-Zn family superoxide dismutase
MEPVEAIAWHCQFSSHLEAWKMRASGILSLIAAFALCAGPVYGSDETKEAETLDEENIDDIEEGEVDDGPHADPSPDDPEAEPTSDHADGNTASGSSSAGGAPAADPASRGSASRGASAEATASFVDRDGKSIGSATLSESPHGVLIHFDLRGLSPGTKAVHIHSVGNCDDRSEGFVASKGHLNPSGKEHGLMNPAGPDSGDLPNLIVRDDGTVQAEMFTTLASLGASQTRGKLLDEDGAALVIHTNRDDHISQPIGGAGSRIACGVIKAK